MAENVGGIYYTVDARTQPLVDKVQTLDGSLDRLQEGFDKTDRSAQNATNGLTKLARAVGAVIAANALRDMARMVQSYQEMAERVQMATSSQEEFEMVQRRLLDTANGTYRALSESQELYIRTADSLRAMGYSTQQALDVTDSMSYAFVKNATSADRAAAATVALSKSINTGKVAADQWETVTTAIPSVIEAIAVASGKTATEVRALGAAGNLTARDLTEGLRKSLDENAQAAAGMANNLTDAAVRSRTAITQVLVALEQQTGALQTFTNGIISAADSILAFGGDAEKMATFLQVLETSAASLAAVITARLVVAVATSTKAFVASTVVAAAKARADLALAQSQAAAAATALIQARAAEQAAVGLSTHAAAARALAGAQAAATTATTTLAAAQRSAAAVAGIASTAMAGLRTTMAFLGGPLGVVLLAATALYTFGGSARDAKPPVDLLTGSIDKLTAAQLALQRAQTGDAMAGLQRSAKTAQNTIQSLETELKLLGSTQYNTLYSGTGPDKTELERRLLEERAALDAINGDLDQYQKRLDEIDNRSSAGAPSPSAAPPTAPTTSPEGQKRIQQLREELELAKLSGEARARLQAIQRLGADATEQERAEAEALATQIYRLDEAQRQLGDTRKANDKDAKKDAAELKRLQEENAKAIGDMATQLELAGLKGRELAEAQALLKLNPYATPEQVAQVRALAVELNKVAEAERLKQQLRAADPMVDAQSSYQAELESLRALNEAKLLEDQRYLELKGIAEENYSARVNALEEERFRRQSMTNQLLIDSLNSLQQAGTSALTGLLTGTSSAQEAMRALAGSILQHAVGALVEMGVQYVKSMVMGQAAQSAAAISAAATGTAMASAYAPAAAMASLASFGSNAAPAAAGITSTMGLAQGLALTGRQYGGPVDASKMYRINENGAPEVFNSANGRQYMLPNQRGHVVSNADATAGGSGMTNIITINVDSAGNSSVDGGTSSTDSMNMANALRNVVVDELERQSRQGGMLWAQRQNQNG